MGALFANAPGFDPRIELPDCELLFWPQLLGVDQSRRLFDALTREVAWETKTIHIFGRDVLSPRLTAWYGDPSTRYRYSGLDLEPLPWIPALLEVRGIVEQLLERTFNGVLCNLYRNGMDSMGWHADDERDLGPEPVIASVSFGATRRFALRHRFAKGLSRHLDLTAGSLLVMAGATQRNWQHAVHKTRRPVGPRINLTFRHTA